MHSIKVSDLSDSHRYRSKMFRPDTHPYTIVRFKKKPTESKLLPTIDDEVKKTFRLTCQENFNQYLVNTTLHGLRYVGDRSITLFERWTSLGFPSLVENCAKVHFVCRFFFVVMFVMVFAFSIYFITNVWIKWSASPMIITLGAMSTSINDFPFPGTFWSTLRFNWVSEIISFLVSRHIV